MQPTVIHTAITGHVTRTRTLLAEALDELGAIDVAASPAPAPGPGAGPPGGRADLLTLLAAQSRDLFASALLGRFSCIHCSSAGPHVSQNGPGVAFKCSKCGAGLERDAVNCSVYASLATTAAIAAAKGKAK